MLTKGTALVTGGAKRIGKTIALRLAEMGYTIALHYRASREEAELIADAIRQYGVECRLFQADLSNMKEVKALIPAVCEHFPNCNVLINNASIFERGRLLETEEDFFDRHFIINFKAPFFLTRDFARQCKKGSVINLLDTKISRTLIEYFAYTLTKKSLYEFTRMAAKELAPDIRVNGVCPGLILPPPGEDESYLTARSGSIPLQRKGEAEEIASAVAFLLENDFVTGDCIFIDGGEHLK